MISTLKPFVTIVLVFWFLGTGIITGFFGDCAYMTMCIFCEDGRMAVMDDLRSVITAGQSNIKDGTEGLLKTESNNNLSQLDKKTLTDNYKVMIMKGFVLNIAYYGFFFFFVSLFFETFSGFKPPIVSTLILSLIIMCLVMAFFSAKFPFFGLYYLFSNWSSVSQYFTGEGGVGEIIEIGHVDKNMPNLDYKSNNQFINDSFR